MGQRISAYREFNLKKGTWKKKKERQENSGPDMEAVRDRTLHQLQNPTKKMPTQLLFFCKEKKKKEKWLGFETVKKIKEENKTEKKNKKHRK